MKTFVGSGLLNGASLVAAIAAIPAFSSLGLKGAISLVFVSFILYCTGIAVGLLGEKQSQPKWIPLHRALHFLACDTRWASKQKNPETQAAFDALVLQEFREARSRGEVTARGRVMEYESGGVQKRASQPINCNFWVEAFFQPHGEIVLADDQRGAVVWPGQKESYRGVVVDWNQVRRKWPSRLWLTSFLKSSPLAAMVEPQRRAIAAERKVLSPAS